MKDYAPQYIKNVVLLGHGGDGKTILTESMLFAAKCIDRMGRIEEKANLNFNDSRTS